MGWSAEKKKKKGGATSPCSYPSLHNRGHLLYSCLSLMFPLPIHQKTLASTIPPNMMVFSLAAGAQGSEVGQSLLPSPSSSSFLVQILGALTRTHGAAVRKEVERGGSRANKWGLELVFDQGETLDIIPCLDVFYAL